MDGIRTTPGGGMEAIGHGGSWETVPKAAQEEIERLWGAISVMNLGFDVDEAIALFGTVQKSSTGARHVIGRSE